MIIQWKASVTLCYKETVVKVDLHTGRVKDSTTLAVPETLVYKLAADICVITEINIQPFQAYFQRDSPIYSAISVRFCMGHPKCPMGDPLGEPLDDTADDKFIWTYSSLRVSNGPGEQLAEPVVCIGGILQIELLGRVQRQEADGFVAHVQVKGRPMSPAFGAEMLGPSGKFVLKGLSWDPTSFLPDGRRRHISWNRVGPKSSSLCDFVDNT
uniref:Uncharacterized protein n=1 Tax=Salix viminalis TaxID=40686 RepID=A0A6N2LAP4_SALVM